MRLIYICCFLMILGLQSKTYAQMQWKSLDSLQSKLLNEEIEKPIFIFFTANWCVYCQKMKQAAFQSPKLVKILESNYFSVEIDVHYPESIQLSHYTFKNSGIGYYRRPFHDLALQLAQRSQDQFSLPFLVILNPDLSVQRRAFSYLSPKQLMLFLQH
ncbi:thioredoxin family protein [Psychroflexus sp. ALD_RP9]|uniref:thioredoxin family protein n=1 Tax=Psychroflexus sp. ALD_RP9 TaxID=2777186 RepID=UPI001A902D79|nr:thioredoxin family protein [Psychroflexus sp. ALD_RP9]QSS96087.1 thioredoxin family protein [Psychroflexus sp. ALD_RP9]